MDISLHLHTLDPRSGDSTSQAPQRPLRLLPPSSIRPRGDRQLVSTHRRGLPFLRPYVIQVGMSELVQPEQNTTDWGPEQQTPIPPSSGGWESGVMVPAEPGDVLTRQRERARVFPPLLLRALTPSWEPHPHDLA